MLIQVGVDGSESASAPDAVLDLHKYYEHQDESVKQSYKSFLEYCAESGTLPPDAQAILDEPPEPSPSGRDRERAARGQAGALDQPEYEMDFDDPCSPKLVNKPASTKGRNFHAFVSAAKPQPNLDEPPSGAADEDSAEHRDRRVTLISMEDRFK